MLLGFFFSIIRYHSFHLGFLSNGMRKQNTFVTCHVFNKQSFVTRKQIDNNVRDLQHNLRSDVWAHLARTRCESFPPDCTRHHSVAEPNQSKILPFKIPECIAKQHPGPSMPMQTICMQANRSFQLEASFRELRCSHLSFFPSAITTMNNIKWAYIFIYCCFYLYLSLFLTVSPLYVLMCS